MSGLINWLRDNVPIYQLKVNKRDQSQDIEVWANLFGFEDDGDGMEAFAEDHKDQWTPVILDIENKESDLLLYKSFLEYVGPTDANGLQWFSFKSEKDILPSESIDAIIKNKKYTNDTFKPWFGIIFTNNLNDKTFYAWLDKEGDIRIIYMTEKVQSLDPTEQLIEWMEN